MRLALPLLLAGGSFLWYEWPSIQSEAEKLKGEVIERRSVKRERHASAPPPDTDANASQSLRSQNGRGPAVSNCTAGFISRAIRSFGHCAADRAGCTVSDVCRNDCKAGWLRGVLARECRCAPRESRNRHPADDCHSARIGAFAYPFHSGRAKGS